jgi:hypothetical protein
VDSYHGRCGWVLGSFGLRAVFVGAGRSADLLAVRIVSSFLGLHLAEFATKEITAWPRRRKTLNLSLPLAIRKRLDKVHETYARAAAA